MKQKIKKMVATILIVTMLVPTTMIGAASTKSKEVQQNKEYLVLTKTKKSSDKILQKYKSVDSEYTENIEDENIILSEMTEEQAEQLESNKDIISVEENISLTASSEYIDPQNVDSNWNLEMINADDLNVEENSKRIKIAIIDSGIDDCDGIEVKKRINLVSTEDEIMPCFDDITGHGTAIASIIAGEKTDDRESYGINNNVDLYSIKIMDGDNTAPLNRVVEGIYLAIENDVDIINMSFGTTMDSEILHTAIQDAYDAGILMIAAAGNRGEGDGKVEYPAAYDEVLSVGSVDASGNVAESSSVGEEVDVMAPGEYIKTAANFGFETVNSGTSMAVPHVVGMASILWQKDKTKSANVIRGLIEESAKIIMEDETTYSIVDLQYALDKYDDYTLNYKNKSYKMETNKEKLDVDSSMAKVSARWSRNSHEALVSNNKNGNLTKKEVNMIKAGIRYNDAFLKRDMNGNGTIEENEKPRGIWHSLSQQSNFMSATFFVGKVIQEDNCNPSNVEKTPGLTTDQVKQMRKDIKNINWKNVMSIKVLKDENKEKYPDTLNNRRLLLFGMELHIITDAFAHRAYRIKKYMDGREWSHWEHIGDPDTDNTKVIPSRYKAAGKVVKNAMEQCLRFSSSGSVSMKKTYTIRSKQIMSGNTYFDGSFLLEYLVSRAKANKANDNTYEAWEEKLLENTYDPTL